MTYDFHSGGTRAGFNSALYNHDDPSNPRLNLHDAVQAIATKGIPRTKLVAGVPFYGRGWRGVESSQAWNTGTGTLQVGGYSVIAETFLKAPGYVRYWDDVAKVPWLYNADKKEWITYEDPQSMRLKGRICRGAESRRRDVLGAVERRRDAARRAEKRSWPHGGGGEVTLEQRCRSRRVAVRSLEARFVGEVSLGRAIGEVLRSQNPDAV